MAGAGLTVYPGILVSDPVVGHTPEWFMAHPDLITHVDPSDFFSYYGAIVYYNSPVFSHAISPTVNNADYHLPWSSAYGAFSNVYFPDAWNHLHTFWAWDMFGHWVVCYHIWSEPIPKPTAQFHATPVDGYAPLQVQFTDDSTNSPTSWIWDFGGGILSDLQNPLVIFKGPGTYTVKLIATNDWGSDQETKTGYITVRKPTPRYKPQSSLNICTPS